MKPNDFDDPIDPIEALRARFQRFRRRPVTSRLRQHLAEGDMAARVIWWRWALPLAAVAAMLLAITINRPAPLAPVASTTELSHGRCGAAVVTGSADGRGHAARATEVTRRVATAPQSAAEPMPKSSPIRRSLSLAVGACARDQFGGKHRGSARPCREIVVAPIEIAPLVIKPLRRRNAWRLPIVVRPITIF
jgi:hypothetical protein